MLRNMEVTQAYALDGLIIIVYMYDMLSSIGSNEILRV